MLYNKVYKKNFKLLSISDTDDIKKTLRTNSIIIFDEKISPINSRNQMTNINPISLITKYATTRQLRVIIFWPSSITNNKYRLRPNYTVDISNSKKELIIINHKINRSTIYEVN